MAIAAPPADAVRTYADAVLSGEVVAGRLVRLACQRHLDDLEYGPARGLVWDAAAAADKIAFFSFLNLPSGEPFHLEPSQQFIVGSTFGWKLADGSRRFRTDYVEEAKGNGKALALDTPIPTPAGWSTMGELAEGDYVFDDLGLPARIIATSDVMTDHDCYRVRFDDGAEIIADAAHLWFTERRTGSHRRTPGIRTTAEIAATLRYANGWYRSANHSIPLAQAVELPDRSLPIEPYALGVWLGDGDSDCARVTIGTQDEAALVAELVAAGTAVAEPRRPIDRTARFLIGSVGVRGPAGRESLNARLRAAGLLHNKHIPAAYLRASAAQRQALLQGLMDTDGHVAPASGQCELTLTNGTLAADALALVRSLGMKPTMRESAAVLDGREVGRRWRLLFHPPVHLKVFRLERKRQHQIVRHQRRALSAERRIVAVERVPSVPVRCIGIDSPSHLFLAGDAFIPTHNTPMAAGIGIIGVIADGHPAAEIYTAGVTRDQAQYLFNDSVMMVEASPALLSRIDIGAHNLAVIATSSYMRPVSSEARSLDQKRVHMALIDEIHEHRTGLVVEKMRAGTKGDPNALIFEITNSGYDRNSICWQHHEYSVKVLEGVIQNDSWFAYIAALDEGDDWTDEAVWPKANPLLGTTVTPRYLREQVQEALDMPAKQSLVKRLNFCIWGEAIAGAIPMEQWDACGEQPAIAPGAVVVGGLDLASTTDLTALLLLHEDGEAIDVLARFWCPEEGIALRSRRDHVPYDLWVREGWIKATPGNVTDYDIVREDIRALAGRYAIREIAYDRWNATQLITQLMSDGARCIPIGQGFATMTAPTKEWLSDIAAGRLRHGGNPVLRWMAANLVVEQDAAGNMKPAKDKSTERIDGQVAAIMAKARLSAPAPEPPLDRTVRSWS